MTEAVWDESGLATHYMADRLDIDMDAREGGFLFFHNNKMIGAWRLYDERGTPDNMMATIMGVAESPRWFTRKTAEAICRMCFYPKPHGKGLKRLNSYVNSENSHSLDFTARAGFTQEGILRQAGPNRTDVVVFGMLKEECPWLPQEDDWPKPDADNPAD